MFHGTTLPNTSDRMSAELLFGQDTYIIVGVAFPSVKHPLRATSMKSHDRQCSESAAGVDPSHAPKLDQSATTKTFGESTVGDTENTALASDHRSRDRALDDYDLLEELGQGGMGIVYKARQRSANRLVAVKMVLDPRRASPTAIRRFRLEAEAAANLDHPNIVTIYHVGESDGQPYFTMRYIEGQSLLALIQNGQRGDSDWSARLVQTVARAVHFAHTRGILHRDIKPGNILIGAGGEPYVSDFGLAKRMGSDAELTRPG